MERLFKLMGIGVFAVSLAVFLFSAVSLAPADGFDPDLLKLSLGLSLFTGLAGIALFKRKFLHDNWKRLIRGLIPGRRRQTEEKIERKIIHRVLEAARMKSVEIQREARTTALLDALEEVVDLPREEMERISADVRRKFDTKKDDPQAPENKPADKLRRLDSSLLPWAIGLLAVLTFLLMRRGSGWCLFTILLLIVAVINFLLKRKPPEDK